MKVLIITKSFPSPQLPVPGVFIKDFANSMSKQHQIEIIAPKPYTNKLLTYLSSKWKAYSKIEQHSQSDHYSIIRPEYFTLPRKYLYRFAGYFYWLGVRKYLRDTKYDIIHVNWLYPDGYIITRISQQETPLVLTIHGSDWYGDSENKKIDNLKYEILKNCSKIITVGNTLKKDIIIKHPEVSNKIESVPNGLDINTILLSNERKEIAFESTSKIKLLMVANFVKIKGHSVLFDALNALMSRGFNDYELILIGNNLDDDYFKWLKTKMSTSGIEEHTKTFISIEREIVYRLYQNCDIFLLPSLREGFGLSLIEAMYFGKPVISTYSGGPEQIVNSSNGILVDPNDSWQLGIAIEEMALNLSRYKADQITKDTIQNYSYDSISAKVTNIYDSIRAEKDV